MHDTFRLHKRHLWGKHGPRRQVVKRASVHPQNQHGSDPGYPLSDFVRLG